MADDDEAPKRPMIAARERGPGPARYVIQPMIAALDRGP